MVNSFKPFDARVRSVYNYLAAAQAIDTKPYYHIYGTQNVLTAIWNLTRWIPIATALNNELSVRFEPVSIFVDDMSNMSDQLPRNLSLARSHANDWAAMVDPTFDREGFVQACFQTSTGIIGQAITPVIPDFVQVIGIIINIAAATILKQSNTTVQGTMSDGNAYRTFATALAAQNNAASGVFTATVVTKTTNAVNATVAALATLTVDSLVNIAGPVSDIGGFIGETAPTDLNAAFNAVDQVQLQTAIDAIYQHIETILAAVDTLLEIRGGETERLSAASAFLESAATALIVPSLMKDPITASVMQSVSTQEFYINVLEPLKPKTVTTPTVPFQPDPTPVVIPDPTPNTPDPNNPYTHGEADSPVVGGDQ